MSWQQVQRVNDLVDGMKVCNQPYIVVRYASKGEVCGDGNAINGFIGYRFHMGQNIRGAPLVTGEIYAGEHMTFYCHKKLGIAYAAIPDCEHNRKLLRATYGEAPFEIEECSDGFKKELLECKEKNIKRNQERNPKLSGPDAFNVTISNKPPEGLAEKKAVIDKLMQKGDVAKNANISNSSAVAAAKS